MSNCPACGQGAQLGPHGEKHGHALWRCRSCGAVSAQAGSADVTSSDLYDRYYDHARFATPPTVVFSLERLVRFAEQFRTVGRWLDLGYGEGGLLTIAERHGWACYGTEVSGRALEHGREQQWIVTSDADGDPRFAAGTFDVVSMIEVLEHLSDPGGSIREAAGWLRPGGALYLTTPNVQSLNGRLLGLRWSIVSPPEHLILYTATALRRALGQAGLRILHLRTEGLNPSELWAWYRDGNIAIRSIDRNRSAVTLSDVLARSSTRRLFKTAVNAALNATRLGDTLKVWACRVD